MDKTIAMSDSQRRAYRTFLYSILLVAIIALIGTIYYAYWNAIPSTIKIRAGVEQTLDFHAPVSGEIYKAREEDVRQVFFLPEKRIDESVKEKDAEEEAISRSVHVDFSKGITMKANRIDQYEMDLKLFGVLPYKSVDVQVIQDKMLIPSGIPIGIYVKTEGVLVVGIGEFEDENGNNVSPAKYALQKGDYILKVDEETVENKRQFISLIEESQKEDRILTIRRGEEITDVMVKPEKNRNGERKLGIWIRDNAQGIGTMTYEDVDSTFGALGHGINDIDTSILMNLEEGTLYRTEIVGITRGTNGTPGELTGYIEYDSENIIGEINSNTEEGIFGQCSETLLEENEYEPIPLALKQEVVLGKAKIICSVTGHPEFYDVEIEELNLDESNVNRGIVIRVTDEKLLTLTGGIIQGMSGSPIIQDGRLVGAVTHVLVNDPTRGYGIFIENMLEH